MCVCVCVGWGGGYIVTPKRPHISIIIVSVITERKKIKVNEQS